MQNEIENLISIFSRLPSIGKRSATRIALHLLQKDKDLLIQFSTVFKEMAEAIKKCSECGNIDIVNPCNICADAKREPGILCVVENIEDLWAINQKNIYRGKYHVLGGVLSAMHGCGPDDLNLNSLVNRIEREEVTELILATNANMDGQTTAFYITDMLKDKNVKITKLANGIPLGSELEFLDEGTLNAAFSSRFKL